MDSKRCSSCKETKSLDRFGNNRTKKDGLQHRCKPCAAAAVTAAKTRSPEVIARVKAREAAWHKANDDREHKTEVMRQSRVRRRAADPEGFKRRQAESFQKWSEQNRDTYLEKKRQWVRDNPEKNRDYVHRYRARKVAATIEPVDYADIAERDQNVCHLCGFEVDLTVGTYHPNARTFDHVIPLTRGGNHSMTNIMVAHRLCNARKNNRLLSAAEQEA